MICNGIRKLIIEIVGFLGIPHLRLGSWQGGQLGLGTDKNLRVALDRWCRLSRFFSISGKHFDFLVLLVLVVFQWIAGLHF